MLLCLLAFASIFVPRTPHAFIVCTYLGAQLQQMLQEESKAMGVQVQLPADHTHVDLRDLKFSGAVFLYHEDGFTLQQMAEIDRCFAQSASAPETMPPEAPVVRVTLPLPVLLTSSLIVSPSEVAIVILPPVALTPVVAPMPPIVRLPVLLTFMTDPAMF